MPNRFKVAIIFFLASIAIVSCNNDVSHITPTPVVTIIPAKIAILNIKTVVTQDGSMQTTAELSLSPIGKGRLEVTAPTEIILGDTRTIKLTIIPDSIDTNGTPTPDGNTSVLHQMVLTQQAVELYPLMVAELSGFDFNILPNSPVDKAVTTNYSTEWVWAISPKIEGDKLLLLSLSTPVVFGENKEIKSVMQLATIEINIKVLPNNAGMLNTTNVSSTPFVPTNTYQPSLTPSLTPTITSTSEPTITPTVTQIPLGEKINENLVSNVGIIVVAIIGFLGVALNSYLQYKVAKTNSGTSKKSKK